MCLADVLLPMDHQLMSSHTASAAHGLAPRASASSLADSDEFRMYNAKILPCRKRYHHDWNECIFSHVGEKVQRRCPRKFNYMGIMCPDMKKFNQCPKEDECCFAHNSFEYWLHPTRYRTEMCTFGPACKRCVCFFAHTPEELRGYTKTLSLANPGMPQYAAQGPNSYHSPSLRTPVVVGNRMDFPSATGGARNMPQDFQANYGRQDMYATQAGRPTMRTPTFSPDPYASPMHAYLANNDAAHHRQSPISHAMAPSPRAAYPLHYTAPTTTSPALTGPSMHLPSPTHALTPQAGEDPMAASARYISHLASRTAPGHAPTYSPSHPTLLDPLPSARSPTAASVTSSHSSSEPALPTTPPGPTPPGPFPSVDAPPPSLYLHTAPTHQPLDIPSTTSAQPGRYSPFSPDSPLFALTCVLGPQATEHTPAADHLADQLADAHLAPRTAPTSHPSTRRSSLHIPTAPASPHARAHSPTLLMDAATAVATDAAAQALPQHNSPSSVLAAMAAKANATATSYQQYAEQYAEQQYQQYVPQMSAGMPAASSPQQLHQLVMSSPPYAALAATVAEMAAPLPISMAEAQAAGYPQLSRGGPQLVMYAHPR